jgi:ZipA, C-terminal FtsZ-binding domain
MSNSLTLTVGLAILGGLALAAVIAHSTWTARKSAVRLPARVEPKQEAADRSTGMDDAWSDDDSDDAALHGRMGHLDLAGALPTSVVRRPAQRLDALIDAIAVVSIEHPLSGDHLIAHMPASRRAGSKPMLTEGLRADSGEWEPLQTGQLYSELQVGVLLANRLGALNEIEYSEFVQKVQTFADAIGGAVDVPDMLDVVARAKELDAFASVHDAQMTMRLIARGSAWSLGFVQQQALKHGLMPGVLPGRLVLPASEEGAPPLLTLQFDSQVALADDPDQTGLREMQLALDVPQTPSNEAPFERWCATAQALAQSLDAFMADDQGRAFSPQAFEAIQLDLHRLYEALAQRDLAAGSAAARRLFS